MTVSLIPECDVYKCMYLYREYTIVIVQQAQLETD